MPLKKRPNPTLLFHFSLLGWGCRIHWLLLYRGVRPLPNKCPGYDTKQFEVPMMLELWGMWSSPSLPSLPGPLWPRVVAPDRTRSMGQIELNCLLMLNWIVWNRTVFIFNSMWTKTIVVLNWITWNRNVFDY